MVAWLRGGHVERFGVAVLICDYVVTAVVDGRPGEQLVAAASAIAVMLMFAWLSFRSGRWWPLVATSGLILCVMVFVLEWLDPALSGYAARSAQVGLWLLVYLALLAGAGERWLAGERPVSGPAMWRRRSRVT
ncbi:MAG: hypothetical protein IR159_09035 [Brevundimonas sp.]|nr:hypothetical protein [Brevundimonas sp.]